MIQTSNKDSTYESMMKKKIFLEGLALKEKYRNFHIYGYFCEKRKIDELSSTQVGVQTG